MSPDAARQRVERGSILGVTRHRRAPRVLARRIARRVARGIARGIARWLARLRVALVPARIGPRSTAARRRRRFAPSRRVARGDARGPPSRSLLCSPSVPAHARRAANYADVLDAPAHVIAEVLGGELRLQPRPAAIHAAAASALGEELGPPFKRGRGGPGGWILLDEPELHLAADICVPDLAGWRRERMPAVPRTAFLTLAPDWIAEVTSPATATYDRTDKLRIYARERVGWVWLVDPQAHTLEVLRLGAEGWLLHASFRDDARVRAAPFDAVEIELGALWCDVEAEPAEPGDPPR
jgi:Uma2 family endonuclease